MTEDEIRKLFKKIGMAPHRINELIRRNREDNESAEEVYQYVKEIMGMDQLSHILYIAFWRAVRDELEGEPPEQITLTLSLIALNIKQELLQVANDMRAAKDSDKNI
jgi:hypothetical protein